MIEPLPNCFSIWLDRGIDCAGPFTHVVYGHAVLLSMSVPVRCDVAILEPCRVKVKRKTSGSHRHKSFICLCSQLCQRSTGALSPSGAARARIAIERDHLVAMRSAGRALAARLARRSRMPWAGRRCSRRCLPLVAIAPHGLRLGHALAGVAAGWLVTGAPASVNRTTLAQLPRLPFWERRQTSTCAFGVHSIYTHSVGAAIIAGAVGPRADAVTPVWPSAAAAAWASHVLLDWLGTDTTPPIGIWRCGRSRVTSTNRPGTSSADRAASVAPRCDRAQHRRRAPGACRPRTVVVVVWLVSRRRSRGASETSVAVGWQRRRRASDLRQYL